jgi:hypothetical protein
MDAPPGISWFYFPEKFGKHHFRDPEELALILLQSENFVTISTFSEWRAAAHWHFPRGIRHKIEAAAVMDHGTGMLRSDRKRVSVIA